MKISQKQLESIAYYERRYEIIFNHPLVAERPIRLSDTLNGGQRRCRFCGKAEPEVSFCTTAHAVPELLGNRSVISMNECDKCNKYLADHYEDHLAKSFGPMRAISQMPGKKGVPTYKEERIRIEMIKTGLQISITDADLISKLDTEGSFSFTLPVDTPSQPYIPIRAAMALVKIACSICPPNELPQCQPAIGWLMRRTSARFSKFPVLYAFTPGPNPYATGKVLLLRRKVDEPIPYLWCVVATTNIRFQFFVPFCPYDAWTKGGAQVSFEGYHFPVPFGDNWECGETEYAVLDWSGIEPVVTNPTITLHVDHAERVDLQPNNEIPEVSG